MSSYFCAESQKGSLFFVIPKKNIDDLFNDSLNPHLLEGKRKRNSSLGMSILVSVLEIQKTTKISCTRVIIIPLHLICFVSACHSTSQKSFEEE